MIAACPKCEARYRVEEDKIGPEGARLRCARCQAVFRVRAPAAAAPSAPRVPVSASQAEARASAPPPARPPAEEPAPKLDPERIVLVADPKEDSGKQTANALASWGLHPLLVHDGVEALMTLQRMLPRVVVLDAALPKMYGFQVCEIVKRNESLKHIKVVLIGAIHHRERYRRPPSELYGADVYLEQPDLPDGLAPLLKQYGLPLSIEAPPQAPAARKAEPVRASAPPPAPRPTPAPQRPAPSAARPTAPPEVASPSPRAATPAPAAADGLGEEREKAERLARIVVSDIVLYQADKFEEGIRTGNLLEALDSAIEEGRTFFRQRIPEAIRNEKDHLVEELLRVARERGMK